MIFYCYRAGEALYINYCCGVTAIAGMLLTCGITNYDDGYSCDYYIYYYCNNWF